MSHIFISYSHKDKAYVDKLKKALEQEGFEVWVDGRIDYGTTWPQIIQKNLDACSAFIVVMTESAYDSKWVHNEVTRAERKKKPFFSLLLNGEAWLSMEAIQYEDVTHGKLPSERFYESLSQVVPRHVHSSPLPPPPPAQEPFWARLYGAFRKSLLKLLPSLRVPGMLAFIAVVIWGSILLIPYLRSLFPPVAPDPTSTNAPVNTAVPESAKTVIRDARNVEMVLVPAGDFTMGRDTGFSNEKPAHRVYLDDFYIDELEVTNVLYQACVTEAKCERPVFTNFYYASARADRPVVSVTWDMAKAYCEWRGASLPTEAQWEKAARGTDERPYPWGQPAPIVQYANYQGEDSKDVGSYPSVKSPYGALDLAGNVAEWVLDWFSPDYYQTVFLNPISNPGGPVNSDYQPPHNFYGRVVRGGSWLSTENYQLSTTYRSHADPDSYADDLGFRCSRAAAP